MKRSLLLVLPFLLAACSTPISKTHEGVEYSVDKTPLLTVVGAAPLGDNYTHAVQVAKADAAASVVKFMANHVRATSETANRTDEGVTVYNGFEKVNESAASMVRGLVFDEEAIEGEQVIVRGLVTAESIGRAKRLQTLMR